MVEKMVAYEHNGRKFEGALVYDESIKARRPAIFMQPDWKGVCADTIEQARTVAGKDYVVLMADMFGQGYGARTKTQDELMKSSRAVRGDVAFIAGCGGKADEALSAEAQKLGLIEPGPKFAIGYCIGGGYALEQARLGADYKALVVFHVTAPNPVRPGKCGIKGRVLAIHGADDPVTNKAQIDALEEELTEAKIDWQLMLFGHAVHSFCDPTANAGPTRYDERLCRKSYALMRALFAEA